MPAADPRTFLATLAREQNLSLAELSRDVGRNSAYLQQFITRGTPKQLPDDVRLKLAMRLRVDERALGAREPWRPGD